MSAALIQRHLPQFNLPLDNSVGRFLGVILFRVLLILRNELFVTI